jgi:hypothetical protein
MPSVEELLSVAEVGADTRIEMDSRIEIDADTRIIQMMPQDELFGVESDEKSERKYFKVHKIVGNGVDLSKLQLRINYQNASKIPSGKDMYIVTDATVYNDEWLYFSWELSRKVTQYKGTIYFVVCAVKANSDGNITNEWNTTLAEGKVLEGLEVETSQEQQYQASDYLEQLKQQLLDYSNEIKDTFPSDYTETVENVKNLKENKVDKTEFRSTLQTVFAYIADIRAYLGITADDIVGIQVDYKNKTFKRLAGAVNLTKGSDFDKFTMFGGRKRCNVADVGSIVAWYGDADYKEDGSMGQVMVYQPKFYYLVCPVEYDPIDTGIGYHLRKANYYVSEKPRAGFRLHPAFYDASGNEIDYFLTSAYEGSIYDASASAYLLNDEQVMNTGEDKFSSIAGARPASGSSQNLTRPNIEAMAQNRGTNWHGDLIKQVSAEQMLMIIEMGMMNLQTAIAQGVVSLPWTAGSDTTSSYAASTGSTASLGNGTGRAEKTTTYEGGAVKEYTVDGKTSVCWRGKENFWGNIWKFVYGINIWGNGKMGGGQPYICSDFSFAESKNSGNYEVAGFTVANAGGCISAMGYSTTCDWLFIASECLGNSSLPVGDYTWLTANLNGYCIAPLGGFWANGGDSGAFSWYLAEGVGSRGRNFGGRLVYIPTKDSSVYNTAIASWKEQMEI